MNKRIALLILLIAYGLLYPGLTQPLLSITAIVEKADMAELGKNIITENPDTPQLIANMADALVANMQITGTVEAYQKTRSIIGTIQDLFAGGNGLVAFLVALFSIVIPVTKGALLLLGAVNSSFVNVSNRLGNLISKWSMADVFVIGVLVAYLAANAVEKDGGLLTFEATLGSGFYFFLAYCLLSILGTQIWLKRSKA